MAAKDQSDLGGFGRIDQQRTGHEIRRRVVAEGGIYAPLDLGMATLSRTRSQVSAAPSDRQIALRRRDI